MEGFEMLRIKALANNTDKNPELELIKLITLYVKLCSWFCIIMEGLPKLQN